MKKRTLKVILSLMLIACMIFPTAMVAVSAAASNTGYEEDSNWSNTNSKAPTDYAYSIAVVGDTQSMVVKDLTNGTDYMSSIYSWIANNVEDKKIQYVLGVGDITEYTENFDDNFDGSWTYADEWEHAKAAITILDDKVPYSLCRGGGHDTSTKLNEYFASHDYYTSNLAGQMTANDVCNTYSTFEVGDVKYLLFALDWNPSDAVLSWAEDIIKANTDRNVILTTHAYLAADGTLIGSSTDHSAVPSTNNGVDIYEKLVSKYDNIQLVISGHDPSANLVYRQDRRESGSVVTSLLVDPQTFDSNNNAETGMVCMLYFSEDGNTVDVEWFSTVREQYYKTSNQFTLKLNKIPTEDGSIITKYGTIPAKYTDADSYPFLCFVDGEFKDLGAYDLFNYDSGTMERALRKLSADQNVVIIARKNITVIDSNNGYLVTNYISANVTIDLMEHTVTNASNTNFSNLFASNATQTFDTNITVKNGTLILGKGLLSVSTGGGEKTQNFTFENLDIVSHYKELIIFNQYKTAGNININLIDCDIVSASNSTTPLGNVFRAGHSSDTTKLINAKTTVKGGSVTLTSFNQTQFVQEYNSSTVTFLPDDNGNMTKVILPTGTSVTEKAYRGENDSSLYLVKNKASDTTDEYAVESLVTPYGTIPYEYSDKTTYPFIAFVNSEVIGSANAFIDESGCLERALRNKNTGEGATIILRCDFTLPKAGYLYTNYQKGVFTIDLMGYTIDGSAFGENLFSSNGTQTFDNTTLVKNGTLKLGKALLSVSTHANAPNKTQNSTFENLNITAPWGHLAFHNNSNSAGNININYVNCNITSSNLASGIFQAGKSSSDTNIATHITVKGGSLNLSAFNQAKLVLEYNGGTVTFLPDDNGNMLKLNTSKTVNLTTEYKGKNGETLTFVKISDTRYILISTELKILGASLNITNDINVLYTVNVPAGYTEPYMVFEFNGKSYTVKDYETNNDGTLVFKFAGVVPQMLGENIKATLYATYNGEEVCYEKAEYSVKTYCVNWLAKDIDTDFRALLSDLLAYGAAAQQYNDQTDGLVNENVTGYAPSTFTEVTETVKGISGGTENDPAKWNSVALRYENAMAMKFKFTATDTTLTVKISINGKETTYKVSDLSKEGDNYVVYFRGILATQYGETVTAAFYNANGEQVGQTVTYSVNSYVYSMQNSDDEKLADLVKATYNYGVSAEAYAGQ